jgi:hypothetical protein
MMAGPTTISISMPLTTSGMRCGGLTLATHPGQANVRHCMTVSGPDGAGSASFKRATRRTLVWQATCSGTGTA